MIHDNISRLFRLTSIIKVVCTTILYKLQPPMWNLGASIVPYKAGSVRLIFLLAFLRCVFRAVNLCYWRWNFYYIQPLRRYYFNCIKNLKIQDTSSVCGILPKRKFISWYRIQRKLFNVVRSSFARFFHLQGIGISQPFPRTFPLACFIQARRFYKSRLTGTQSTLTSPSCLSCRSVDWTGFK